jgi:hypothetical protein
MIPNTVSYIGHYAFYRCYGLTDMYVKAEIPPSLGINVFTSMYDTIPIHVPCGKETAYKNTEWNFFTNIIGDIPFDITMQSNDVSMGTVNIIQTNTCANDTAIIEATTNAGYRFVQWNDGNTQNPRTITVIQDTTLTAIFEALISVTLTANNPVMGSVTGEGYYIKDSTAILTAMPNTNYRFVQWNDGDTNNPCTITTIQDTTFMATFEALICVIVTANNPVMGSVTGEGYYIKDSTAILTAAPNTGYYFIQWNDGITDNPRTITVIQDTTLTAIFEVEIGIANIEAPTISIYPNPATDNIHIVLPENILHALFILYDMQGKVLIRREINNQDMVSISNLATGMYIYNVRTSKQNHTGKLIRK